MACRTPTSLHTMQRLTRLTRLRPGTQFPLYRPVRQVAPLHHLHNHHTVHVQRVRFQPPKTRSSRKLSKLLFIALGMYATTILFFELLDIGVEVSDWDEDEDEEVGDHEAHEEHGGKKDRADDAKPHGAGEGDPLGREGAEDVTFQMFIPFPFTETEVPSPHYVVGSPEWQAIDKIKRDERQVTKIRYNLAADLASTLDRLLGGEKRGRVVGWTNLLIVEIPFAPPPTWEQTGILIRSSGPTTSLGVAKIQNVDAGQMRKLHKILWPVPVAKGLWEYTKEAASHAYADFSRRGSNPAPQAASPAAAASSSPTMPPPGASPGAAIPPFLARGQTAGANAPGQQQHQQRVNQPQQVQRSDPTKPLGNADAVSMERLVRVPPDMLRELAPGPWNRLVSTLRMAWLRMGDRSPPKGCVLVHGRVKVNFNRGFVMLYAHAWWNPAAQAFDKPSMFWKVINHISYDHKEGIHKREGE